MKKTLRPKIFRGEIVSHRMDKTAVILVMRFRKVKKYGKYVKLSKRFKAHDEKNEYRVGERVLICETKPISKGKRWKIIQRI